MLYPLLKHLSHAPLVVVLTLPFSIVEFFWPVQAQETPEIVLQVQGRLEPEDDTFSDGSFYDVHVFEGKAGQTVGITLESLEFDSFLLLQDATGEQLAENDDIDEQTRHSFIEISFPEDGTYRILANSYKAKQTGDYSLSVMLVSGEAQPLLSDNALRQNEANRLLQQGIDQFNISQFREAMQSWEQALEVYREIGDRAGEGQALGNLGLVYDNLGQYQQAIDLHEQRLSIAREMGDWIAPHSVVNSSPAQIFRHRKPGRLVAQVKES